jgi:hypothetical protein
MARLAAQEKGEFYPTPPAVVETIANLLHVEEVRNEPVVRLFDPCAGAGEALAQVAGILRTRTAHEVQTWGVEINPRRAAEAAERLDHVVPSPFEVVGWKPKRWGVASLLWLNPPYDFSASTSFRRMETFFLEKATPALEPGGLLVYLVPPAALDWQGLRTLWQWYEDLSIYRFPDEEYDRFHQVVILGKRLRVRDRHRYPGGLMAELSGAYGSIVERIRDEAPSLAALGGPLVIPTTRTRATLYRAAWSKDEMAAKVETALFTSSLPQRGQTVVGWAEKERTNFSNISPHF